MKSLAYNKNRTHHGIYSQYTQLITDCKFRQTRHLVGNLVGWPAEKSSHFILGHCLAMNQIFSSGVELESSTTTTTTMAIGASTPLHNQQ